MPDDFLIHLDRLGAKPAVFEGTFVPADLERLEDSLADGRGELHYRISARLDPQRRTVVSCIINGFVFLTCQVSLEAFRHEIGLEERLILVNSEAELPAIEEEGDSEDYVVADEDPDIRDLVEDAVLLALPMIPRKPGVEEPKGETRGAGESVSPFAALASLKRPK